MTLRRKAARLCAAGMMMISVGCQARGQSRLADRKPQVQPTHSVTQLLAVARQYEKEGQNEQAGLYYTRVLAADPMNADAAKGLYLVTSGQPRGQHEIQQLIASESGKNRYHQSPQGHLTPAQIDESVARMIANAAATAKKVEPDSTPNVVVQTMAPTPMVAATAAPVAAGVPAAQPVAAVPASRPAETPSSDSVEGVVRMSDADQSYDSELDLELANPFVDSDAQADGHKQLAAAPHVQKMPVIAANAHSVASAQKTLPGATDWKSNSPFQPRSMIRLCQGADQTVLAEVEKLDRPEADIRKQGLTALANMGPAAKSARLPIKMLLDDPDELVVAHSAGALWEIDREAWESVTPLSSLLASNRPEVVQVAAYTLGAIGADAASAAGALRQVLATGDASLQLHAAEARSSPSSPKISRRWGPSSN